MTAVRRSALTLLLAAALCGPHAYARQAVAPAQPASAAVALPAATELAELRAYIKKTWLTLTRTLSDLPAAAPDPKFPRPAGTPWPVYVATTEDVGRVTAQLDATLKGDARRQIAIRVLPAGPLAQADHGLLYLPKPYVVPGGRFNEMYGWDSYFILVGLVRDDEIERARDLVDNFVYQIRHYGTILNANRTYYLTRSQPPFLTRMALAVFERTGDLAWLRGVWPAVESHYRYWLVDRHLAGDTGLSRYWDFGEGPAPEAVSDERDAEGRTHYDRAKEFYRTTRVADYDVGLFYDRAADALTPLFYKGDRSMRESGFDPSNRFGPFSVDIVHYAPVCLNSLLYQMERDAAEIARVLALPDQAQVWTDRAAVRRERMNRYLWDEAAGLFLDYNTRTGARRNYLFATTFYPLWAGMATAEQARRVRESLAKLEAPGGLLTSTTRSGSQWDAPFGWAPLQLIAAEALRRYGYEADADRLATKFVALVAKELGEHGTIVEKYDVTRRESDVAADITFGYAANQAGFGWTNGVVLELLADLDSRARARAAQAVSRRQPAHAGM
jgi:alpha,alpha-trehalase